MAGRLGEGPHTIGLLRQGGTVLPAQKNMPRQYAKQNMPRQYAKQGLPGGTGGNMDRIELEIKGDEVKCLVSLRFCLSSGSAPI